VAGREGERVVGGLSPPVHPHSPRLRSRLSTGGSPVSSFGFDVPSPSGSAGHHGTSGRGCPAFVSCAFSCCTRLGLACGSAGKQGNRGAVRGGAVWRCGLGWGGVGWCVVVWAGVWKAGGGGGWWAAGRALCLHVPPLHTTCCLDMLRWWRRWRRGGFGVKPRPCQSCAGHHRLWCAGEQVPTAPAPL
jgi:hypothetical protein